ncbi:MAG: N-acyl amino acid synthase FeeM domain-containing protein, partial [Bacteroidota bacterium]
MVNYKVASTFQEVTEAWCLVYKQYLAASLIMPNELSVFTFPEYISPNAAVFMGKKMGHTVSTVSAVLDSNRGLPLDHYYQNELDQLRQEGKKLIEIGLLADTRAAGNFQNITELMSGIARFGVYSDNHDYVIGVHPRRMAFFNQVFGFKQVGEVRDYGKLRTAPVVLLHANGIDLQSE